MSNLMSYVDNLNTTQIAGWIDDGGPVKAIDIEIDGKWVCTLEPSLYRPDLESAGFGDGRRAFNFPLHGRLGASSVVTVKYQDRVIFEDRVADAANPRQLSPEAEHARTQQRWRSDEPALQLTWGQPMTGDSLWDLYQGWRTFGGGERILEIGPGYGRLLKTALQRKLPFATYTGVELSQARVDRLAAEFPDPRVRFMQGDVDTWTGAAPLDVVVCSSTFEHLHPDCRRGLQNLGRQLAPGGQVFIDFIEAGEGIQHFEPNGTFVRAYTKDELATIFRECGYTVRAIETCTLGQGHMGPVRRFVVAASRG